jgi:hypothetical protein
MRKNDNPAFAELPSVFAYRPLEKLNIVVAARASIGGGPTRRLRLDSLSQLVGPSIQQHRKEGLPTKLYDHTVEFAKMFPKARFGRKPPHPGDATMFVVGFGAAVPIIFFRMAALG